MPKLKYRNMSKANFHIFTYMFRPVNESPSDLFADEFNTVDVKDSINRKQEILADILDNLSSQSSGENHRDRFIDPKE